MGRSGASYSATDRWLTPIHGGIALTSQAVTAGRVYLVQFVLPAARVIDGITYVVGSASTGNVRVGIVGPVAVTADTAAAAPVLVQSASVAQGSANSPHFVSLTATPAPAGVYYAAFQGDNASGTYMRHGNQLQVAGITQTYDRAGGYGAFTDPTPAVSDGGSAMPGLRIRLA
jgi:hypothetical protein